MLTRRYSEFQLDNSTLIHGSKLARGLVALANSVFSGTHVLLPEMVEEMGTASKPRGFQRQAENFGNTYTLIPSSSSISTSGEERARSGVERGLGSMNDSNDLKGKQGLGGARQATSLLQTSPQESATVASLESLFAEKRKTKSRLIVAPELEKKSFQEFAQEMMGDNYEEVKQGIIRAKAKFNSSGLPVLRLALMANTMNRIRVVYWQLVGEKFAQAISKKELVNRCIAFLLDRFRARLDSVANQIGDFGVVKEDSTADLVRKGELVLLKTNSVDNLAAPCVAQACSLQGWVCRNQDELVQVEVSVGNLLWGELYMHKKISLSD